MHWRWKWQSTPVFLPGESQARWSLVDCFLWGRTESDTTEVTAAAAAEFQQYKLTRKKFPYKFIFNSDLLSIGISDGAY